MEFRRNSFSKWNFAEQAHGNGQMKFVHESNKINKTHRQNLIQMTTNREKCGLTQKNSVRRVHMRKIKEITFICAEMTRISNAFD